MKITLELDLDNNNDSKALDTIRLFKNNESVLVISDYWAKVTIKHLEKLSHATIMRDEYYAILKDLRSALEFSVRK